MRFKKFESFFLDVTFDGEGTLLQIKETRTEWLRNTTHFVIRKDGRDVGTIRTDPALRQQLRLQEVSDSFLDSHEKDRCSSERGLHCDEFTTRGATSL